MTCYLCDGPHGRIAVESKTGTFWVCGTCSETGLYCDSCEVPLRDNDYRIERPGPWGMPTDRFECDRCAEAGQWAYQESRVF